MATAADTKTPRGGGNSKPPAVKPEGILEKLARKAREATARIDQRRKEYDSAWDEIVRRGMPK